MKRLLFLCSILFTLIILSVAFKNNDIDVQKFLHEGEAVIHIHSVSRNEAIVFYSGVSDFEYLGYMLVEKNFFTWNHIRGSGAQTKETNNLEGAFWNTDLAIGVGKIFNPEITQVFVEEENGVRIQAQIIEHADNTKIWYLVSDRFDTHKVTVVGLSDSNVVLDSFTINQLKVEQ